MTDTIKIGILREEKTPADARVPLSPQQCRLLLDTYPQVQLAVAPSPHRCFSDADFEALHIPMQQDLSDCDILLGVKEVPPSCIVADKTYLFFSHTIKKQAHNQKLLRQALDQKIRLIDYECLRRPDGKRIIGFGRYAGIVGAHNGLQALAKKLNLYDIPSAYSYQNFEAIKANDGDWKLKNGAQLGLKWIDVAGVSHLDMQIEWNAVRPYTYTHQRVATNYSHYNAPLAHPLGTNFKEWLGIVRYMPHHRLQLQFTMMHAVYGKNRGIIDDGGDIFTESNLLESKGNYIGQGVRFEIDMGELVMTYMPKHNFFIDLTLWHRSQHTAKQTLSSNFVSLALRWNMAGRGYRF